MERKVLSKEEFLKLNKAGLLNVEQALISQDLSISLNEVSTYINEINEVRLKELSEAKFPMPVPKINTSLIAVTDNFTQGVCNTYRVVIKPLLKTTATKELPQN